MFYDRKIIKRLKDYLNTQEIVVLTGMRRTGKTTLYRKIFEDIPSDNKVFLDIENPLDQKIFEEIDYNNIWANLKPYGISNKQKAYIFLDEVQASPQIVCAVKYLYDHYDVKFFLTGSSSFYLKNLFSESLAGRKVVFELYPLDFEEFLTFKGFRRDFYEDFALKEKHKNEIIFEKTKKFYDEYLEYGGFPQVVLAEDSVKKKEHLRDIFKSYFEKDVRSLAHFRELKAFRDLMLLLMQRVGSKLEINKLASETGVSRETVYSYISFLEATYFIELIPVFTQNRDREVSGAKKIYLCDNGMLNQFARVTDGSLLENAVYRNLKQYGEVKYYQRRSGREIDFVLMDAGIALEVKRSAAVTDYQRLKVLAEPLNLGEYYLITKTFNPLPGFIQAQDV